jgi:hypothetical protein
MLIQKQAKVKVLGAAMILALMFVCSMAAFAAVTANPISIQFPSTTVGTTSAAMSVTVTNTNRGAVTITGASVSLAQFSYSGPSFPITLASGQSFTGSVTFSPAVAQAYSGTLTFVRNGVASFAVKLKGTGIKPVVSEALVASPSALSFSAQVGSAAPAAQSVTIGENPAGAAAFSVSADQAWINLSAASGTTSGTISVGANISGLAAGSYSGNVIVSAAGMTNSPMSIPVTLVVAAAAQASPYVLTMSPSSLAFSGAVGSTPACQALIVDDTTPGGPLPVVMSSDAAWLSVTPSSGNTKLATSVCVKTTGLAAGNFTGHIIATATGPNTAGKTVNNSLMSIPVTFVVTGAPASLTAAPSALSFSAQAGASVDYVERNVGNNIRRDSSWREHERNGGGKL